MVITPLQEISHSYRTLYSELAQRALDGVFASEFDLTGRFISSESRGRRYWYFDHADGAGGKKRSYVGPVDDPEITRRVENFKDLKADYRERRKLVSTLVREAHLPSPEREAGEIVQALANAGFFRLRGVLVGTVAFQSYAAILGVRLPGASMVTGDADFAQFHSISVAVEDEMPPVLETLRAVDPTFREIPHSTDGRFSTQFASRSGYRVEFLTPNTGSDDYGGKPARMPALGGAAAQPLRFLDFLIHRPARAVMLFGAGVSINVPAPERYAIHKLIVAHSSDGDGAAKSGKDVAQAKAIMLILLDQGRAEDLAEVFMEAWDRGPAWQVAIRRSLATIPNTERMRIMGELADAIRKLADDAAKYLPA